MQNNHWTRKTIENRLKDYYKRLRFIDINVDPDEFIKVKNIIEDLEEIMTLYADEEEVEMVSIDEVIEEHADLMEIAGSVGSIVSSFDSSFNFLCNVKEPRQSRLRFPVKAKIDFMYEFFNSLGPRYFDHFKKLYDKISTNHYFFYSDEPMAQVGFMFPVRHVKEIYSASLLEHNVGDFLTPIHEFGHGVEFLMTHDTFVHGCNKCFTEVVPMFFEMIATLKLEEMYDFSKAIKKYNLACAKMYHADAKSTTLEWKATELALPLIGKSEKQICELVGRQMHVSYPRARSLITAIDFERDLRYSLAYIIAIELYMVYKESPNDALDIVERVILNNDKETDVILDILDKADCYPGKRSEEFKLILK